MDNTDSSTHKDQNQKQENFYLPEFFQKEFPHLSQFLEQNLINRDTSPNIKNSRKN